MVNFTVGPVQSSEEVRAIGGEQIPYFRTAEFSSIMLENERLILEFAKAPPGSRAVFLTASGTGGMESVVASMLSRQDRVLVVNGGSFGHRFAQLCKIHGVPYDEVTPPVGDTVSEEQLENAVNSVEMKRGCDGITKFTALLVNIHETSTGVWYDADVLSRFCKRHQLLFIVDAISSFLADPFDMTALGADIMIVGSQKALACPPGVSIVVLSPRAIACVRKNDSNCFYLDLKEALKNQERGQTPFTCAVGTLLQIHARLKEIESIGGVESETKKIAALAADFRARIVRLPFVITSKRMSNAVTPLRPAWMDDSWSGGGCEKKLNANEIFLKLKDEYGIWICPNGGDLKDRLFRVGHLGDLTTADNDALIAALTDLHQKELI